MLKVSAFLSSTAVLAAAISGCGVDGYIGNALQPSVGEAQPATSLQQPTTSSPQVTAAAPVAPPAPSLPITGDWYLNQEGARVKLTLTTDELGLMQGTLGDETASAQLSSIEGATYDSNDGRLAFRVSTASGSRWYQLRFLDGIVTGRFGDTAGDAAPADATALTTRVTGWHEQTFSRDIAPRVFDLVLDATSRAVLRLDRSAPRTPSFLGTLKIYATAAGVEDEHPEEDVEITSWDGTTLGFTRPGSPAHEQFTGVVSGRGISGTFVTAGSSSPRAWSGERIEILSHGLTARSAASTRHWQERTRARMGFLMMDGAPAPLTSKVTTLAELDAAAKFQSPPNRDDGEGVGVDSPTYHLTELSFESTLANRYGGEPLTRRAHGWISVPATPAPAGGYPVVLAVNGHWGSAARLFDGQDVYYWYGDSFARHDAVVIAIDMGHRPVEDRAKLYDDAATDDPAEGNFNHPAIKAPGMSSDWEEDGERVWDAMRGLDYALGRPDVNPARVTVVGLSMGGQVSDLIGALELRVGTQVAAGSPPDFAVMSVHGNHACWKWNRGEVREYYEPGDLHALVAGRTLVRETGKVDACYSRLATPYIGAKQVVRRAQPAFDALGGQLVHYLHDDEHHFRAGEKLPGDAAPRGVLVPALHEPDPENLWAVDWELDGQTVVLSPSVFNLMPQ